MSLISLQCYPGGGQWNFHANSMGMLQITKKPKCMRSHKPTMLPRWRTVLIKSLKEASLKQAANSRNQLRAVVI